MTSLIFSTALSCVITPLLSNQRVHGKATKVFPFHLSAEMLQVALQVCATKLNFHKSSFVASLEHLESLKRNVRYSHARLSSIYNSANMMAFMKGAPEAVLSVYTYNRMGESLSKELKNEIMSVLRKDS